MHQRRPDPRYEKVLTGVFDGMQQGKAWTAAGFKSTGKVASVKCCEFLKKPYARQRLAELAERVMKKTDVTVENVIEEIKCHAFYDITQILNVDRQGTVTMRDPTSLPEDLRRATRASGWRDPACSTCASWTTSWCSRRPAGGSGRRSRRSTRYLARSAIRVHR